jgi:hypothetical protein
VKHDVSEKSPANQGFSHGLRADCYSVINDQSSERTEVSLNRFARSYLTRNVFNVIEREITFSWDGLKVIGGNTYETPDIFNSFSWSFDRALHSRSKSEGRFNVNDALQYFSLVRFDLCDCDH